MTNPISYETGKLIEACYAAGWDITFHGVTAEYPNGHITADLWDVDELDECSLLLSDTVVIPYSKVNELIIEFMKEEGIRNEQV